MNMKDIDNKSALDYANGKGDLEMIEFLESGI